MFKKHKQLAGKDSRFIHLANVHSHEIKKWFSVQYMPGLVFDTGLEKYKRL